jgi:peroxiredoxin
MKSLVGQPAMPFKIIDSLGKLHSLDDYRGGWLLMVFHRHLG